MKFEHGYNCEKAPHGGSGYLHDTDDNRPFLVDGKMYCGRCHYYIPDIACDDKEDDNA